MSKHPVKQPRRRSVQPSTLQSGMLVFGWDMIMQQQVTADCERMKKRRKHKAVRSNACDNPKRTAHTYHIGDMVLIVLDGTDVTRNSQ